MRAQDHIRHERSICVAGWRWIATSTAIGALLALQGCASTPRDMPSQQFTQTQDAISEAVEQGAREDAAAEIAAAEEHFAKAKAAADNKDYEIALLYAEKAEADAKLAEARAERADMNGSLKELKESIRVLKDEIDRQLDERGQEQS
jgi:chromosome segregation ATPase